MKQPSKNLGYLNVAVLLALGLFSNSCSDDDYDLNDINMTISAGGEEFFIPTSSTKKITLKDLLDIKEDDIVQPDNEGNYVLSEKLGKLNKTKIRIDAITIASATIAAPAKSIDALSLPQQNFDLIVNLPTVKSPFKSTTANMPKELVALNKLTVNTDITVTLKIEGIEGTSLRSLAKNVTIIFPPFIKSNQLINRLFKVPKDADLTKGYSAKINVYQLYGFNLNYVNGTQLSYKNQEFIAAGEIEVKGQIELIGDGTEVSVNNPQMTITTTMSPMTIEEASGIFAPTIKLDNQEILITNLPEFLTDKDVIFDVNNPKLNVEINNSSPLAPMFNGKLIAIKDGVETASVNIAYKMKPNQNNRICFSRLGQGGSIGYENVTVPNLHKLLRIIPDKIILRPTLTPTADVAAVKLGSTYTIDPSYELVVPLLFGPDLNIVYNESCWDWNNSLKNLEINKASIYMTAVNKTPLKLHITASAIDVNGQELSDVVVKVDNNVAAEPLANTQMSLSIDCHKGKMKLVDGLVLRVNATAPDDSGIKAYILNEKQTVQFLNMKVKVIGGITADLN